MSLSDAFNVGPVADPDAYAAGLSALPDYSVGQSVQVPDGPQFGPPPPVPANVQAMDAAAGLGPPVNPGAWSGAPPAPSPGIIDYNVGLAPPAPVAANVPQVAGATLGSPGASAPIVPSAPAPLDNPGATAAIGPFAKGGMFDPTRKRATYHMGPHGEQVPDWSGEPAPPESPTAVQETPPGTANQSFAPGYGPTDNNMSVQPAPRQPISFERDKPFIFAKKASPPGEKGPDAPKKNTPADDVAQDITAVGDADAGVGKAQARGVDFQADALRDVAGIKEAGAKRLAGLSAKAAADSEDFRRKYEDESRASEEFAKNPQNYVHHYSLFQKILLGIGAAAGGVARGIKGGSNSVLDGIKEQAARDIQAQRSQYEAMKKRGVDIYNQWAMNRAATGNDIDAERLSQTQLTDAAMDYYGANVMQSKNPTLIAQYEKNRAQYNLERSEFILNRSDMAAAAAAKKGAGQGGYTKRLQENIRLIAAHPEKYGVTEAGGIVDRATAITPDDNGNFPSNLRGSTIESNAKPSDKAAEAAKANAAASADLAKMSELANRNVGGAMTPSEAAEFKAVQAHYALMKASASGALKQLTAVQKNAEAGTGDDSMTDIAGGRRAKIKATQAAEDAPPPFPVVPE